MNVGAGVGSGGVNVGVGAGGATVGVGVGGGGVNVGGGVGGTGVSIGAGSGGVNVGAGTGGAGVGVGVGTGGVNVGVGAGGTGAGVSVGGMAGTGSAATSGAMSGRAVGSPVFPSVGAAGINGGLAAGVGGTAGTAQSGLGVQGGRDAAAASDGGRGVGIRFRPSLPLSAGSRLVTLPPSLSPARPNERHVRVTLADVGTVTSTPASVALLGAGLVPRPGTSMDIVRSCRAAAVGAARSLPVERVDVASAGPTREDGSALVAPVEFRILYRKRKGPGLEAKQAVSRCELDAGGNVLALR